MLEETDSLPATGRESILAFLFLPTCYMDPSWWSAYKLPEALCRRLAEDPRSHRHLSRRVLREMDLDRPACLNLPPAATRLAVMYEQRLGRLLVLAGLTLLSPSISSVLHREERQRIKSDVGDDGYEFAVRRGRFLLQQSHLGDVLPADSPADFNVSIQRCRGLGMGALAGALCDAPAGLVRRLQLKFPKDSVGRYWRPLAVKPAEFMRLFTLLDLQADVV